MFSTNFISATKEYSEYLKYIPASYFRKTFRLNGCNGKQVAFSGFNIKDNNALKPC